MVCSALLAMLVASAASDAGGHYRGPYPGHYRGHHGGHHWRGSSFGVIVGVPLVGPYFAPGPFYDWPYTLPSRTVIVESPRTVYIERDSVLEAGPPAVESSGDWWYYCRKPRGYYPDVERCPGGWERVPPRSE